MLTNITVVTFNRLELTKLCLDSVLRRTKGNFVLTVVDNGSSDGTRAYLDTLSKQSDKIRVFSLPRNMGVAVAANLGWASIDAEYYVKLDNDVMVLDDDWLTVLLDVAHAHHEIGLISHLLAP